jgi:hypothetical protein
MELNDLYTTDVSYEGVPEILAFDTTFEADVIILESDGKTNTTADERMD